MRTHVLIKKSECRTKIRWKDNVKIYFQKRGRWSCELD